MLVRQRKKQETLMTFGVSRSIDFRGQQVEVKASYHFKMCSSSSCLCTTLHLPDHKAVHPRSHLAAVS